MINFGLLTSVTCSVGALFGLWFLYFVLYRDYRIDLFRNRVFGLRQYLFDLAARGEVDFDHPAYGMLRTTMNGFIRLADSIDAVTGFFMAMALRGTGPEEMPDFAKMWSKETADLAPDARKKLDAVRLRMNILVADQLVFTSAVLTLTIIPVVLWVTVKTFMRRMIEGFIDTTRPKFMDRVDSTAFAAGGA